MTFAKSYAIGKYEVTFDEYDVFLNNIDRDGGCQNGHRPERAGDGGWGHGRRPVIYVSWDDATCYADWLSKKLGHRYRLPTESEWEYAAGTITAYWWDDEAGTNNANCRGCDSRWDYKQTAPVDAFKPNPLGLYNTAGNVWEWVEDCWHENYQAAPSDGSRWGEEHARDCAERVIRGGSWYNKPRYARSAFRGGNPPAYRLHTLGFRLAQDLE